MEKDKQALAKAPFFKMGTFFPTLWEDMVNQIADLGGEQTGLSIYEEGKNIIVEAAAPGLKPEEIDVTIEKGGILRIQGESKKEEGDKAKKFYRKAVSSFSYRVVLPAQIDESKDPKAEYKDGIMKITFDKAAGSQTKKINIKRA